MHPDFAAFLDDAQDERLEYADVAWRQLGHEWTPEMEARRVAKIARIRRNAAPVDPTAGGRDMPLTLWMVLRGD